MSTYTTETIETDLFIPHDEVYLPDVPLTGQQLDALETAKDCGEEFPAPVELHHERIAAATTPDDLHTWVAEHRATAYTTYAPTLARPASDLSRSS